MVSVTTANPPETFFHGDTQRSKHTGFTPVMLLSEDCTGQQLGLSKRSRVSVKLGCKQTKSLSCMLGLFVATPARTET